jgi:tRNA A-37 threonylcarbamoyl transferase component Bud32
MSKALNDKSIFQTLSRPVATVFDSMKLNSIAEHFRHGRHVIVKGRSQPGRKIAHLANLYFRMARIPISYWTTVQDWQRWEVKWFRILNPRFIAYRRNHHEVCIEKLPGKSLWDHMREHTLTARMVKAAGREFRRAHSIHCEELAGPFSHGDASMSNVIYDSATDRARLIDFEIVHDKTKPAVVRHADDLAVFLLDLAGYTSRRRWLPMALAFLRAYGDTAAIEELQKRLVAPRGMARIWWKVRSNFMPSRKISHRLARLRQALECGALQLPLKRHRRASDASAPSSMSPASKADAPQSTATR